jgi:hypothetical protein
MTAVRCLLAALLLPLPAVCQQTPPAPAPQSQEQPATPPAGAPQGSDISGLPKGLTPLSPQDASLSSIPDIKAHRGTPLPYVRDRANVVPLSLGKIDPEAEVVLVADGRKVSRNEFRRRALMFAAVNETDKYVTKILTEIEMSRAQAANEQRDFSVSDAEIDARLEDTKNLIRAQARGQMVPDASITPSDDPNDPGERAVKDYIDSINDSIGMVEYRKLLAGDQLFEKVYLPFPAQKVEGEAWDFSKGPPPLDEPKPDWMPAATWDAMGRNEQGRNLRSFIKQWAINGEEIPAMFKPSILGMVRDGLIANITVSFFFDEPMPDNVFMRVGDRVVTTDELWPLVAGRLNDTDIELIARELLTLEALHKNLVAAGAWMDDVQFKDAWTAYDAQYASSFIPLRTILQLRGYTSVDRFREHFRYRESYNKWKKAGLTDEEVLAHYQGGGRLFFERGNIVIDAAFLPLGNKPFNDANLDALQTEMEKAVADAKAGAKEGEDWFAALMAKYPAPEARQPSDGHTFQRNQLSMQTAESELSLFLTGYSKTQDAFYLADKGDIIGPWVERCRHHAWGAETNAGAWVIRVKDFTRRGPLPTFEGRNRDLAYEDWCDLNFFNWAQEGLKAILTKTQVPKSG